ncbi:MAG: DNA-protecting protein DprA [Proteobacteria bacterium]|nr:DNA-protecting protein DprA [Pseudomonadota bacterium]
MEADARACAWLRLAVAALPHASLVAALRAAQDPEAVVAAPHRYLSPDGCARLPAADDARIVASQAWLAADPAHRLCTWDDDDYPRTLLNIAEAPPALFLIGRAALLARPAVAIVGSRNATPQGRDDARAFAQALATAGVTVVSGLATGIDAAAHEGALEAPGSTIAVVGTGLDRVYPAANRALAHAIAARGCLVSEFPPGTPPLPHNFPRRNRLIAGLARGVVVVEANLKSGSLITARLAGDQGREVMAVPGSIHSPQSRGCHKLIRDGAKLVETAQDVLSELALTPDELASAPLEPDRHHEDSAAPSLESATAETIVSALGHAPADLDRLIARTGLPAQVIAAELAALEIAGRVAAVPGGGWQRRT